MSNSPSKGTALITGASGGIGAVYAHGRCGRGKRATARYSKVLAPIYGRFTEGFETADLKSAKMILEA